MTVDMTDTTDTTLLGGRRLFINLAMDVVLEERNGVFKRHLTRYV